MPDSPTANQLRAALGRHLQIWQKRKGYTQKDVAQMIGVGRSFYNKLIFGIGVFSLDLLCTISEVTEIPPHELLLPPEQPLVPSKNWKAQDLVARLDNVRAIAVALEP